VWLTTAPYNSLHQTSDAAGQPLGIPWRLHPYKRMQRDGVHRLKNLAENDAKSESTSPTVWHLSEAGGAKDPTMKKKKKKGKKHHAS
jgi:hypothetical protein